MSRENGGRGEEGFKVQKKCHAEDIYLQADSFIVQIFSSLRPANGKLLIESSKILSHARLQVVCTIWWIFCLPDEHM